MLVLGLGGAILSFNYRDFSLSFSGMSLAAIIGILLNLLLPNEKEENITETPNNDSQTKEQKKMSNSKKIIELNHPLIEHKLGILRNKNTGTKEFRELAGEIATFLCYKAMEDAELEYTEIETPICKMKTKKLNEDKYAFVPILRAGMGMLDGVITVIPNAKIGHIGMYRDEKTHKPVNYFFKVPKNIDQKEVILLDPMLATGGSAIDAIDLLKEKNVKFLVDINILDGNNVVSISNTKMKIRVAIPNDLKGFNKYEVVYIKDGLIKETLPATLDNGYIVFETTHLSHYGILASTSNPNTGDNIMYYVVTSVLVTICLTSMFVYKKRSDF